MTRASGTTAVRYGTMRDNVLGFEAVLADGRIIRTGSRARKSSAGYDLTALLVGSEGTLALVTELTLKLHGQPEAITAAICAFDTVDDAVRAVIDTIQMGLSMARIELLDAETVRAFNAYAGAEMPNAPHLMVEFHGSTSGVEEMAETFGAIIADHNGHGFDWATRPEDRNALWTMRHNGAYAIFGARPGWKSLVTDVCVPISRLADAINETAADLADSGLYGPSSGMSGMAIFTRSSCSTPPTRTLSSVSKSPQTAWSNAALRWVAPPPANTASALANSTIWRLNMAMPGGGDGGGHQTSP